MREVQFEIFEGPALLPGYPVECFRGTYSYGMCAPLHWHTASEIIFVNEGTQEVTAGNHIEHLRPGSLIYINPEQVHLAYSGGQQNTVLTVLKFTPGLLCSAIGGEAEERLLAPFLEQDLTQSLVFPAEFLPPRVPALLDELVCVTEKREYGCEFHARVCICELLWILAVVLHGSGGIVTDGAPLAEQELERFRTVLRYIDEHYPHAIPLSSLTDICCLSYSNFAAKFRQFTGKTPVEYINHVRISHAQQMLLSTNAPISEIAGFCGFGDFCYFSRVFRRISGQSPQGFRKGLRSERTF